MLKLVESYLPFPLRVSVWWFGPGVYLGLPQPKGADRVRLENKMD